MMDINLILEYLPHRYPFVLVDQVVAVDNDNSIRGYKNVSINEHYFLGHFPGNPIMPGVLQMEALAQISGILVTYLTNGGPTDSFSFYLAGMEKVRYKNPVVPGNRLDLESVLLTDRRGICKFDCKATVDGRLTSSGQILLAKRMLE